MRGVCRGLTAQGRGGGGFMLLRRCFTEFSHTMNCQTSSHLSIRVMMCEVPLGTTSFNGAGHGENFPRTRIGVSNINLYSKFLSRHQKGTVRDPGNIKNFYEIYAICVCMWLQLRGG